MASSNLRESLSTNPSSNSDLDSTPKTRLKHSLEYKFKVLQQYEQSHLTVYHFCKLHPAIKRRNLRRWIVNKDNMYSLLEQWGIVPKGKYIKNNNKKDNKKIYNKEYDFQKPFFENKEDYEKLYDN